MSAKTNAIDVSIMKDGFDFENSAISELQLTVLDAYRNTVIEKFGQFKQELLAHDMNKYEELINKLSIMDAEATDRFFLIPEITHRMLYYTPERLRGAADFISMALDAEQARINETFDTAQYDQLWTADGSFFIKYDQDEKDFVGYEAYRLFDTVPIDFFSPYCLKISNQDVNEQEKSAISIFNMEEIEGICDNVEATIAPILGFPHLTTQVSRFLRAIIFNRITVDNKSFGLVSGSDGRYPGRTVISNADVFGAEKLMEAFVHESIHATMYMIDVCNKWLPSWEYTAKVGNNVTSPWTGNKISICSIQEAVFVWYGVYNLWTLAAKHNLYADGYAERRALYIRNGFKKLEIEEIGSKYGFPVSDVMAGTVEYIKNKVTR